MRISSGLLFFVVGLLACLPASAAPLLECVKPKIGHMAVVLAAACADEALVKLDRDVAAAFDAAIASATDHLTSTLLAGENRRRQLIFESANQDEETRSPVAPVLAFVRQSLERDVTILSAMTRRQPNDGVAGDWANAFGALSITAQGQSGYHLSVKRSRIQNDRQQDHYEILNTVVSCDFDADLTVGQDGWLVAKTKTEDAPPTKLTRQGISLRLFVGEAERSQGGGSCDVHDAATGTYFRVAAQPDRLVIATARAPERPSFACGKGAGVIETEICSDPELARQDRALAKVYPRVLARLEPETAVLFKVDQTDWIKRRASDYDSDLWPLFYKLDTVSDNFGAARESLVGTTAGRIGVLAGIEGRRDGFVGDWWSAAGTFVHIGRTADGKFHLNGMIWGRDRKPTFCAYEADPALDRGVLAAPAVQSPDPDDAKSTVRMAPSVWSDGRTLLIDADRGSATAHYCRRGQHSADRLFPIKGDDKNNLEWAISSLQQLDP